MLDALFIEEVVPMLDEVRAQIICFVYTQDEFFVLVDFFDILFQICRIKEIWVSGIDDLE